MRIVIVTGMSGAGKSSVLKMLEDVGYFCVDNIPIALIPKFICLSADKHVETFKVALGVDIRSGHALDGLDKILDEITEDGYDFAYVHVEAPDEMGHQGSMEKKIQSIENLDQNVIDVIVRGLEKAGEDFRLLILPDHPTPIRVRTHTGDPVPYLLYDSTKEVNGLDTYNEKNARVSGIVWEEGFRLIDHLLGE